METLQPASCSKKQLHVNEIYSSVEIDETLFFQMSRRKSGGVCGSNLAHGRLFHFNPLLATISSEKLRQLTIGCAKSIHPFVEIQYRALVFLEGVSGAAAWIPVRGPHMKHPSVSQNGVDSDVGRAAA